IDWVGTKSWNVKGWDGVTFTEIINGVKLDYVDFKLTLDGDNNLYFQPTNLYICMEYNGGTDESEDAKVNLKWYDHDYSEEALFDDGGKKDLDLKKAPVGSGMYDETYSIYQIVPETKNMVTQNGGVFSIEICELEDNCSIGFANIVLVGNIQDEDGNNLDDFQYTISPNADGGEISRLNEITVVANNSVIEFNDYELSHIVVKNANGKELAHVTGYEALKYRNGLCYGYKFTLNKDVVAAGTHTFTIPKGVFNIGCTELVNEELTTNISIDGSEEDVDVYFEPEIGTTFDQLDKITVYSDSISKNDEYSGEGITVVDEDGNNIDVTVNLEDATDDNGTAVAITFEPAITTAGECTVKIPEGFFCLGESQTHVNDALEYKCTVDYSFTTASDGSGTNLNKITVTANGPITINEDKLSEVVVKKDGGEQVTYAASYEAITENGKITGYTLTLADNIIVKGNYTYTIPAGLFNCERTENTNHELDKVTVYVDGSEDTYEDLSVSVSDQSTTPESLEELSNEFSLTVSTNETYKNHEFSLVLSIDNITTGENIITADMSRNGDSSDGYTYSWTNDEAETLLSGNSYLFSVEVKTSDNNVSDVIGIFDLFTVAGTGSGWSSTTVSGISPEEGEISMSDNMFTLSFDIENALAVKVYKDDSYIKAGDNQYSFESIESDGEYSDTWTLTVSDEVMGKVAKAGGMELIIVAKDKKGFTVGSDEAETITYSYTLTAPTVDIDNEVKDSDEIIISAENINKNENYEGDGITVVDGDGNEVNVTAKVEKVTNEDGSSSVVITFEPELTTAGDYTIVIPEGFFLLGENMAYESDEITLSCSIDYTLTTSPSGSLSSMSEITVLANGVISVNEDKLSELIVTNESGETVATAVSYEPIKYVNNNIVEYRFDLNDTIVAAGNYTYSIPAGLLSLGSTGNTNAAIVGTVEIDGTKDDNTVYTLTPLDGSTVTSLSEFTVEADGHIVINSALYDATSLYVKSDTARAGVHVKSAEPIYGDDNITVIGYTFTLESEITDNGTYTITIPDGFFLTGDEEAVLSSKLSVTFYIDMSTGINNVGLRATGDDRFYNLNGQRVTAPHNGIYILNGNKVRIK
ncbi:MAG: hypothetical protein LUD48_02600, partial [Prevotella sp.]|nr:hypothetical protein [Prevotella sp.]